MTNGNTMELRTNTHRPLELTLQSQKKWLAELLAFFRIGYDGVW